MLSARRSNRDQASASARGARLRSLSEAWSVRYPPRTANACPGPLDS